MQVGSLVVCIDDNIRAERRWLNCPKQNELYVIRAINISTDEGHSYAVLLDEIVNPIAEWGEEYAFYIERFKELQPPMDLSTLFTDQLTITNGNIIK